MYTVWFVSPVAVPQNLWSLVVLQLYSAVLMLAKRVMGFSVPPLQLEYCWALQAALAALLWPGIFCCISTAEAVSMVEETPLKIPVPSPTPMQLSPPQAGHRYGFLTTADAASALSALRLQPWDCSVQTGCGSVSGPGAAACLGWPQVTVSLLQ